MPTAITESRLIVVEGKDDVGFLEGFLTRQSIRGIQVLYVDGKDNLGPELMALRSTPGFGRVVALGVMRDSDKDPIATLQSTRDALARAGLPVPTGVLAPVAGVPRVTILLLPDGDTPGELEDLCLRVVAADPAIQCVCDYFRCLRRAGIQDPRKRSKARLAVYLASKPVLLRVGEAAKAGHFPWDAAAFSDLRRFIDLVAC